MSDPEIECDIDSPIGFLTRICLIEDAQIGIHADIEETAPMWKNRSIGLTLTGRNDP